MATIPLTNRVSLVWHGQETPCRYSYILQIFNIWLFNWCFYFLIQLSLEKKYATKIFVPVLFIRKVKQRNPQIHSILDPKSCHNFLQQFWIFWTSLDDVPLSSIFSSLLQKSCNHMSRSLQTSKSFLYRLQLPVNIYIQVLIKPKIFPSCLFAPPASIVL